MASPNIKLEVVGLEKTMAALSGLGDKALHGMAAAFYQEAESLMAESKRLVPVDLNTLRSSGYVELPVIDGNQVTVICGYGGAASKYAIYVHEGTGPAVGHARYFPPKEALEDWARRHGFDDVGAVQWAIYLHGTEPVKYLERPFRRRRNGLDARLARRIKGSIPEMT